jgi:hypothetical protein
MRKAFIAMRGDPEETEWKEVYALSHATFKKYAKKHGYDFLPLWYDNLDCARWPGLITGREPRWKHDPSRTHPYWLKIPAIIETLEKYDVVVYMDSDCLILDHSVDIASTVHRTIAMAEVAGWGGKVVSTAVSVTHRSEVGLKFWNEAWTCDAYKRNTGWADNANVAYLLGWSLNAPWVHYEGSPYTPHFHDLGVEWNGYTEHGGEYVPGCRVFHASGSGDAATKLGWMRDKIEMRKKGI